MTVPQCEVAGIAVTTRDAVPAGGRSWNGDGRGSHQRESHCSGDAPLRPASPSQGSSPEVETQTRGRRINPARTGREPQATLPSSPQSTAPERSPSLPRHQPSACRQDGDSFFPPFSGLIYCLAATSGADAPAPQLCFRHFRSDLDRVIAAGLAQCARREEGCCPQYCELRIPLLKNRFVASWSGHTSPSREDCVREDPCLQLACVWTLEELWTVF